MLDLTGFVKICLSSIRKSAHGTPMQDYVDKEVSYAFKSIDEHFVENIQSSTKKMVEAMENAPSIWVAHHNIEFMFKRRPVLQFYADKCVDRVEASGKNPLALSSAFRVFTDMNYFFDTDMSENGQHVVDMPFDQIIKRMDELTTLSIDMSPKEFQMYANEVDKQRMREHCIAHGVDVTW